MFSLVFASKASLPSRPIAQQHSSMRGAPSPSRSFALSARTQCWRLVPSQAAGGDEPEVVREFREDTGVESAPSQQQKGGYLYADENPQVCCLDWRSGGSLSALTLGRPASGHSSRPLLHFPHCVTFRRRPNTPLPLFLSQPPRDNMSREMKQRLRKEYLSLGGSENVAATNWALYIILAISFLAVASWLTGAL